MKENNEFPTLSVLVLTYNHEKYINDSLKSILSCDYPNMHVWVLDDGSTDSTKNIIKNIAENDSRLTLLTQKNSGGKIAENTQKLIDTSRSEYILLISGDDILGPNYAIKQAIAYMQKHQDCHVVFPRMVWMSDDPSVTAQYTYSKNFLNILMTGDPKEVLEQHLYKHVSDIFVQGLVIKRKTLIAMGGFNSGLISDDYAFIFRLFSYLNKHKLKFFFNQNMFWIYRIHEKGIHNNAIHQLSLTMEVVNRFVPEQYLYNFKWHEVMVHSFNDLIQVINLFENYFGRNKPKYLLYRMEKKLLIELYKNKNKKEISDMMKSDILHKKNRLKAFFYLYFGKVYKK